MGKVCCGECIINHDEINFVGFRQVRYGNGMRSCYICQKAWVTNQKFCHCCKTMMRYKRRAKKNVISIHGGTPNE